MCKKFPESTAITQDTAKAASLYASRWLIESSEKCKSRAKEIVVDAIPNAELRLADLPVPEADWAAIWRLADTFNGYKHWGSFEKCAEIGNAQCHSTLTELRTCLFFECRRWQHYGEDPDEEATLYIRELVAKIRARVAARALE